VGPQDAELASPSSPNLIRTKNEGRCVALVAYLTSFTERMRVILAWTGQEATFTGAPRAGAVQPGREFSSGVSRDEQKLVHPVHQDEYFQVRSFAASEQVRSPRSAPGEADLRNPVVQTAALLTEQVQLLQSRVLPRAVGRVLFRQKKESGLSDKFL